MIAGIGLLLASCGGGTDVTETSPVGETATTGSPGESTTTAAETASPQDNPDCDPDRICEVEYQMKELAIGDDELEELVVDGTTAYVTTDSGSVLVVDLNSGTVEQTLEFDAAAVDIALDGTDLWVLTVDGPVLYDVAASSMGTAVPLPTLATAGQIAVGDGAVWVTTNGTGEVSRLDTATGEFTATITDYDNMSAGGSPSIVVDDTSVWAIDELGGRVLQIDPSNDQIVNTYDDLGFTAEDGGDGLTTILADGPRSIATFENSVWVLSDMAGSEDGVAGVAALFRLDSGSSEKVMDLIGDPSRGSDFVVTPNAIWYIDYTSYELIRADRATGLQHRIRPPGYFSGNDLAMGDGTIWMTAGGSLLSADIAELESILGP